MHIKNLSILLLIGGVSFSANSNSNEHFNNQTINIYNNVSQQLSTDIITTNNKNITIDLPNTYIDNSFYFNLIHNKQFQNYKYFNVSKHNENFSNFINEIVTFYNTVTGKEEIYILKSISNQFITLQNTETDKITIKNVDSLSEFHFPEYNYKDSNNFVNIILNKDYSDLKINDSYLFHGLEWKPHYSTLIDFDNNKGYFNYNIDIINNTDTDFKNININLLDENLNIHQQQNRPQKVFSNRANFSKDMVVESQVNNDITTNYELGKEIINLKNNNYIIPSKESTTIPYKINTNFSFTPNYLFNFYNIKDNEEKYINPNLQLVIKRDENKEFLFNLPNGKNYLYNYKTNNLIKIINTSETKESELNFNLGDTKLLEANIKKNLISYDNKYINDILEKIAKIKDIDLPLSPRVLVSENIISFSKKDSFNQKNSTTTLRFNAKILKENINYQKAIDGFYKEISNLQALNNNKYNNRYQYINVIKKLFNIYFEKYTRDEVIVNDINNKKRILTIELRI